MPVPPDPKGHHDLPIRTHHSRLRRAHVAHRRVRGDAMTAHMVLLSAPIAYAVLILTFHVLVSFDLLSFRQESTK